MFKHFLTSPVRKPRVLSHDMEMSAPLTIKHLCVSAVYFSTFDKKTSQSLHTLGNKEVYVRRKPTVRSLFHYPVTSSIHLNNRFRIDYGRLLYRVRQKYLTILQNSCEWNRWRGEFVLERSSSETRSISVAMECWSVEHRSFAVETYFKDNDSVLTEEDISSALQYSSERVSLVVILLPLRISQEQGVRK
jgi:hypothetical protein